MTYDQIKDVIDLHVDDYSFGIFNREDGQLEAGFATQFFAKQISDEMNETYPNDTYVVRIRIERVEI